MDQTRRDQDTIRLNLATRSTELRALTSDCSLRWLLDKTVPEDEGPLVTWFLLGNVVHKAIERMSLDLDLDPLYATAGAQYEIIKQTHDAEFEGRPILFSKARPDVSAVTIAAKDLILDWYDQAHPASDKRHPFYRALQFPPRAEVYMEDAEHGVYSTADAIFEVDGDALADSSHVIVDYKSGMGRTADPLQLWFYYYIGRRTGEIPDVPFFGVFHHLSHRSLQYAAPYPGDSTIKAMLDRAVAIKTGGHFIPQSGWYCNYCPWKETHCPLYSEAELSEVVGQYEVVVE